MRKIWFSMFRLPECGTNFSLELVKDVDGWIRVSREDRGEPQWAILKFDREKKRWSFACANKAQMPWPELTQGVENFLNFYELHGECPPDSMPRELEPAQDWLELKCMAQHLRQIGMTHIENHEVAQHLAVAANGVQRASRMLYERAVPASIDIVEFIEEPEPFQDVPRTMAFSSRHVAHDVCTRCHSKGTITEVDGNASNHSGVAYYEVPCPECTPKETPAP